MKNILLLSLVIMSLCSCESEPTVTAEYPITFNNYSGEISFQSKNPDTYLVFDENRLCPYNHSNAFRTYKPARGLSINKGDLCARPGCGYSWDLHDKK